MSTKTIWLPSSETTVTVRDGKVTITESMVMTPKPVKKPNGFSA